MNKCLIQLGRTGDLLNILPIAIDEHCSIMACRNSADMLDGCSQVEWEKWDGDICDWQGAVEQAKGRYEQVIVTQLFPNYRDQVRTQAQYCLDEWDRAGRLTDYGKLALAFDRRDSAAELRLFSSIDNGLPLLLYSTVGISGPLRNAQWLRSELLKWSDQFNLVDLDHVRVARFYDLLGLYDRAALLVTIDTAHLHLCWASKVPAIQILSFEPEPWHGSTPKGNCILSMKYAELQGRIGEIHDVIRKSIHA